MASNIQTTVPVANSPLQSDPIRTQFRTAASEITQLQADVRTLQSGGPGAQASNVTVNPAIRGATNAQAAIQAVSDAVGSPAGTGVTNVTGTANRIVTTPAGGITNTGSIDLATVSGLPTGAQANATVTVDTYGRVTALTAGSGTGNGPSGGVTQVTAGAGLTITGPAATPQINIATGGLPIAQGGTGATTPAAARTALAMNIQQASSQGDAETQSAANQGTIYYWT